MKFKLSIDPESQVDFSEDGENVIFLAKRGERERKILLRNEPILLCFGGGGFFVSDGYRLFCVDNGFVECIYEAVYKIYELISVSGAVLVADENILTYVDGGGKLLWQYWHVEPIIKMTVHGDYVELVDESKSVLRVSIKDGKPV